MLDEFVDHSGKNVEFVNIDEDGNFVDVEEDINLESEGEFENE